MMCTEGHVQWHNLICVSVDCQRSEYRLLITHEHRVQLSLSRCAVLPDLQLSNHILMTDLKEGRYDTLTYFIPAALVPGRSLCPFSDWRS